MDTLFDVLHVVTAVFIVGPMAILPMTALRSLRSGNSAQVATLAKSTNIFTLLSLLVVLFGFGVLGMSDPKYNLSVTTPWVLTSIILYALALALSLFVVVPSLRAAAEQLATATTSADATGGVAAVPAPGTARREDDRVGGYGKIAGSSGLVSLLLVAVVVLMVWKP